jgi:hypothetical protein
MVKTRMFGRKKKQPWWTWPIVFGAALYGLLQAELHTKFIWKSIVKRIAIEKLLEFLDKKFPTKERNHAAQHADRSTV